jgi:hypothetical protein
MKIAGVDFKQYNEIMGQPFAVERIVESIKQM